MKTEIIKLDPGRYDLKNLEPAARCVKEGGLVVFPTETVYGIAVNASMSSSISRLLEVRRSPQEKLLTRHIADPEEIAAVAGRPLSGPLGRVARKFLPGPLTIVAAGKGGEGVGIRCPANRIARDLIRLAACPVAAPSANLSGDPPALTAGEARKSLDGLVDFIIDGGRVQYGKASTVVRIGDKGIEILREGAIPGSLVREAAATTILFVCTGNTCRSPVAEVLMRKLLAEKLGVKAEDLTDKGYRVISAGTIAGAGVPAAEETRRTAAEAGMNLDNHASQPVTNTLLDDSDYVYVMTKSHRETLLEWAPDCAAKIHLIDPGGEEIPDPVGGGMADYRESMRLIEKALRKRLKEF